MKTKLLLLIPAIVVGFFILVAPKISVANRNYTVNREKINADTLLGSILTNPGADSVRIYIYGDSYSDVITAKSEATGDYYTASGSVNVTTGQCNIFVYDYPSGTRSLHYVGQFSFPE